MNRINTDGIAGNEALARYVQSSGHVAVGTARATERFALAARKFYRRLPKTPDAQIPGVQFYKAASAMPANYRAARRGRSRAEFIAKLGTVVEESDETIGWLEHMTNGEIAVDAALLPEARELCAIFTASLTTARRNAARAKKRERDGRTRRS